MEAENISEVVAGMIVKPRKIGRMWRVVCLCSVFEGVL